MRDELQISEEVNAERHDFDSMNLQVGTRLQLFTHRQIKPMQYFSTLIGYVRDEYLLVKMPFDNGSYVTLHDGEKVTIRVFSGTSICSFASTVIRTFFHPFFYVHLMFPSTIECKGLRAAMRVKVDFPGQIRKAKDASAATEVRVSNLSVAGALIESKQELGEVEQALCLSISPPAPAGERETPIETKAVIRNVTRRKAPSQEQQDIHLYGMQFVDLNPNHRLVLRNLTYEALLADRQNIV